MKKQQILPTLLVGSGAIFATLTVHNDNPTWLRLLCSLIAVLSLVGAFFSSIPRQAYHEMKAKWIRLTILLFLSVVSNVIVLALIVPVRFSDWERSLMVGYVCFGVVFPLLCIKWWLLSFKASPDAQTDD